MSEIKEQIRNQYLKSLPAKIENINAQIEKYYEGSDMADQNLRMLAHSLHGSGATFGFPGISRAAAQVEQAVGEEIIPRMKVLAQLLQAVVAGNPVKSDYEEPAHEEDDGSKKVLIIESEQAVTDQVVNALKALPEKIRVHTVKDAEHAELCLTSGSYDLVVLDLILPDKDGRAVLREIKLDLQLQVPVLMLSGITKDLVRVDCMSLGADSYLQKPFTAESLDSAIKGLLESAKEHQTLSLVPMDETQDKTTAEQEDDLPLEGHTILVVDDDKHLGDLVCHLMDDQGALSHYVSNGREALDYLQFSKCSLVILDVKMPDIDGFHVLEKIRGPLDLRGLPVILLTSLEGEDEILRGFDLGANDYIHKPFSEAHLVARVKSLLSHH